MLTKEFPIEAVITVTSGKLVSFISEVHKLLDWMTGEPLMTHQLPRASEESEEALRTQHPWLRDVKVPEGTDTWEKVDAFLEPLLSSGATVAVAPLDKSDHTSIDPITELHMMRPDMPIVGVVVDDDEA